MAVRRACYGEGKGVSGRQETHVTLEGLKVAGLVFIIP